MPNPHDYKTESDFMHVCIPMLKREGKKQDQAIAVCISMWKHKDAAYKSELNDEYEVPYLGGMSQDRKTCYIDCDLDPTITVSGQEIDPRPFLMIHETTESHFMDQGETYQEAHKKASQAEQSAVENAGLNWKEYNVALAPFIKEDEEKVITNPPPDLDKKPYIDEHDKKDLEEIS